VGLVSENSNFGQPRALAHGRPIYAHPPRRQAKHVRGRGGQRCVTPRQTCPRPNGLGRNLRSKTRWFTGFCNSHQVSHFATFFIDARAEISVAESRFGSLKKATLPARAPCPGRRERALSLGFPWRSPRRGSLLRRGGEDARRSERPAPARPVGAPRHEARTPPMFLSRVRGSFCWAGLDNDPSAGSPTETLLRLLLPLNDKVQWTSRDVAGSEPPASPRSEHFTGPFNR
jgi:hypothetical protein